MSSQVQFRRGTATQNNAFTGAIGELSIDTDNKTIRIHDGSTAGGGAVVMTTGATQTVLNKTFSTGSVWNGSAIPMAYGGTGSSLSATAGAVPYSTASGMGLSLAGTSGQVLVSGGTNAPSWVSPSSITAGTAATAVTAQNIAGGSAGQLMIQSDVNLTTFITAGAYGTFLQSAGAGYAPTWAAGQVTYGNTVVSLGGTGTGIWGLSNLNVSGSNVSMSPYTGAIVSAGGIGLTGDIYLTGNIVTTGHGYFSIPTGNTFQRPTSGTVALGQIRYNTQLSSFEGYGAGNAWSSLGGVTSVDKYAYISAEAYAGAGDDVLRFYSGSNGSSQQVMWASGANISILTNTTSTSTTTGALQVTGGVGMTGNLNVGANVTIIGSTPTNGRSAVEIIGNPGGSTLGPNTTGVMLHVTGQPNNPARVYVDGQGNGQYGAYIGRQYNGSTGSATATLQNNVVARFGATPYTSTGWPTISTTRIDMVADENQTSTNRGSRMDFFITPVGSTESSISKQMTIDTNGVHIPGNLYVTGTTTTINTTIEQVTGTEVVAGVLTANSTTPSTSTSTGALVVRGGAGIGGSLWVGGNINLVGNVQTVNITGSNGTFYGNTAGFGALYAGLSTGYVLDTQVVYQDTANFNGYAGMLAGQNINSGALASADVFLTPDNGTQNDTYLDLGIASSTYNYPGYNLIKPNDAYLFNWGNAITGGGNLILGTGYVNDIVFAVQGINTNNEVMRINSANVVSISSTVRSTSTSTGALTVAGGVGKIGRASCRERV